MNRITFSLRWLSPPPEEYVGGCYVVDIAVDDRDLLDLVRDAERPFAAAEGHPDIAGGYESLPAEDVLPPSRHFLGDNSDGEKMSLYECVCRFPGCWPLLTRIAITHDLVTWSDFEQPHRGPKSAASWWLYHGLGPFTFDRRQYEHALKQAAADLRTIVPSTAIERERP